jgi:2-hydroxy-5-methyl-1-naphthoate 7-hydroxylase
VVNHSPVVVDNSGEIHAQGAEIRAQGPVTRIELPGGVFAWSITGYAEARLALADQRFSKSARLHWPALADRTVAADFPLIGWALMDNVSTAHGADHSRLRRLIIKAFGPRRVEAMRPHVEKIVAELLDDLAATPPGEPVDLRAAFAHPMPVRVICDLFGVRADETEMLRGGEVNVSTALTPEEVAANVARWFRTIREFVESKRRDPGDDLTSDLIAVQEEDGSRLTDDELVATLHFMRAAGTVPEMNLLTSAVFGLLTRPEQLELVRSGAVGWSQVIEETLRVDAPVAHLPFRFATEDVEIGGVRIPKGEPVLINYAAVGRDPARHGASAEEFDVTRADKEHLSFGHGIYRCIGVALARLEAEIALPALFDRFPGLTLAVPAAELEPQETLVMNGRNTLPVYLKEHAE